MQSSSYLNQSFNRSEIKDKIISVFWITFFWFLLSIYQYADRYSILVNNDCVDDSYEHGPFIKGMVITVLLAGSIVGTSLVFIWETWLRKLAYLRALGYIILFYTTFYIVITVLATFSFSKDDPGILIDNSLFKTIINTVFNINALPNFLFWLFISLFSIIFLLIRDKFGPKTFLGFVTGKYFRPKREERIFMFMDLKSSTTIAEKLGEEKYFNFLNDTFKLSTPGILSTEGEIYQYVGDEIVVSWKNKKGIFKANCIQCYFEMVRLLQNKAAYFERKYGIQPKFKAGLHHGHVIAGEMGIIKREIVYSGDVLNTASRIQALCNQMNTEIIISKKLMDKIDVTYLAQKIKYIGEIDLRGKLEKVELVTLLNSDI